MNKNIIYIMGLLFFISLNLSFSQELTNEQIKKIEDLTKDVNRAHDFTLSSIYNNKDTTYVLSEMKDKVILINFWATWCGPCRLEIPDFNNLYNKYNERGFEILSISIQDTKEQLEIFLKAYKMNYPVLYGSSAKIQKIISEYGGVYSIPTSFLVGKNNEIKRIYPGAILKQYDPNMYSDLVYNIEALIAKNLQEEVIDSLKKK